MENNFSEISSWTKSFVALNADRSTMLKEALDAMGVKNRLIELESARFILAWPKASIINEHYRMKIISAHHDRVPGTPGALDNSAACIQLLSFLQKNTGSFNTMVVFTDREELGIFSPMEQGSYLLGKAMSVLGLNDPAAFPLDVTGRGDCLVLSMAPNRFLSDKEEEKQKSWNISNTLLKGIALETDDLATRAKRMMAGRATVYRLALPFGEDLGYILAGIPAVLASILPKSEAEAMVSESAFPSWASLEPPGERMPETWQKLHSPNDNINLFTDTAFELVHKYLTRLGALKLSARIKI